jgi:predicted Zn-dependent protease
VLHGGHTICSAYGTLCGCCRIAVINSPDVNAFVAPGGKVVAYTGLLQLVRSEDELAAVLAHEV